ncbi:MAG TPA: TraB/GumN family protein [Spirochaetota bacterium]|nr:TraB/GumN family protein [Spirochaetota bacterium]HPR35981.1 TraB/GumN family protein [Spirochaetota bacterium]
MHNFQIKSIEETEQNIHKIIFENEKQLYLIGTAHVSKNSAELVESKILEIKPDIVCIELDEQRFNSIKNRNKYENIDIFKIIKNKQLFFFIGQFIMASFQKKISEKTGSRPGEEFIRAINVSETKGIPLALIDRNIGTTLKRAWRLTPLKHKFRFMGSLFFSDNEEFDNLDIEQLKKSDAIETLVNSFAEELPETKKVLIDERDLYLAYGIQQNLSNVTVAVVGAGHVPGILKYLSEDISDAEKQNIDFIPERSKTGSIIKWGIPAIILIVFIWGFYSGNKDVAKDFALIWIFAHGLLTVLGCIISLAHPLTILTGFIASPITSLNPTIGAGLVTALVQAIIVKPRIKDFEQLNNSSLKFRQWWENRLTKIFLVFLFSSIGSSIGTFIALPALISFFK